MQPERAVMDRRYFNSFLERGLLVLTVASAAELSAEPVFSAAETDRCVSAAVATSPGLTGHSVLDCVGRAAAACMMTPGGDTTVGMMDCLDGELGYWDGRLNAAYARRIAAAKTQDSEIQTLGSSAVPVEDSLRAMQRAWVSFSVASCLYEQAQWMGGTGGGPATLACLMQETARQALRLEGWWAQ
jgi:uncharacterized protein YecT (DUF1311 family)